MGTLVKNFFFHTVLGFPDGIPGLVMVIHTFGDYARFHPHLHAIVANGLFRKNGTVLPRCEMKQLEEIFRSRILAMLKRIIPIQLIFTGSYWPYARKICVD
jgi:hypothetical protein